MKKKKRKLNKRASKTRKKVKGKISRKKIAKKVVKKKKFATGKKKAIELNRIADELIAKGRKRGFITYDEILKTFPNIENNILFLDELYEKLAIAGIDVLEGGNLLNLDIEPTDKDLNKSGIYDSIQMYLKEIGQYPLIHASDEKELAKRIEKGDLEA